MNLIAKHQSNIEKLQKKEIVKYGRETQNRREEKKLLPFFRFFTMLMNLRAKHPSNRGKLQKKVKYGRRTKNRREEKSCYLFCALHGAHKSDSKTFIQ